MLAPHALILHQQYVLHVLNLRVLMRPSFYRRFIYIDEMCALAHLRARAVHCPTHNA